MKNAKKFYEKTDMGQKVLPCPCALPRAVRAAIACIRGKIALTLGLAHLSFDGIFKV